ncbi:MAG: aminotransferase class III-fold pyridoxal phosphate-dependent enzyme [Planctomycetes bacterium]|nr:aminotransferase class III-fold pyridoxal phosphate-dependent enzyme [Planctomycetota bacterium]
MSSPRPQNRPARRPAVTCEAALGIARELWGVTGRITELPSDRDRNFRVDAEGESLVLKVTDAALDEIELAAAALERLDGAGGSLAVGRSRRCLRGELAQTVSGEDGRSHRAWAVQWVDGTPLAEAGDRSPELFRALGEELGRARIALDGWDHPGLDRDLKWDLHKGVEVAWGRESFIQCPRERRVVREGLATAEVALASCGDRLRVGVIHGDANDHNILVRESDPASWPCGLLDVGDINRGWVLGEVSIAAAYLLQGETEPLKVLTEFVAGYHQRDPIPEDEVGLILELLRLRLCVSVSVSAEQRAEEPGNEYLSVSYKPALELLALIQRWDPEEVRRSLAVACGLELDEVSHNVGKLGDRRRALLGPNLSVSYSEPLEIVRGEGRYLVDASGRSYLDGVNNVPQVGHGHPDVVARAARQMGALNTNTRYLSDVRLRFVERLLGTLPAPLEVVYLVNSGSEANELARRMVHAHSGRGDWVVIDGGYHGNTEALVELSPYKFNGPGGGGRRGHVHVAALPDRYRGPWGYDLDDAGERYAADVERLVGEVHASDRRVSAFLAESISGCGGQVVFPPGYLAGCYDVVRSQGGLVIADEVQVGCGRVGSHWWAFETQCVTPDIVTMGKPLGNGHPIGAVVTTREVASSFDNGMEYFNTFGGNPVSCAVADEVLKVIEEEGLREGAARTGGILLDGLREMQERHSELGDVRGLGLYLGVVCVRDRESKKPDARLAKAVVEGARARGVLLSTDGMEHDVIKVKPPLVFTEGDAEHLLAVLEEALNDAKGT